MNSEKRAENIWFTDRVLEVCITIDHTDFLYVAISTVVGSCLNSRCSRLWIYQQPSVIEQSSKLLNRLLVMMNLSVVQDYIRIEKSCLINFGYWSSTEKVDKRPTPIPTHLCNNYTERPTCAIAAAVEMNPAAGAHKYQKGMSVARPRVCWDAYCCCNCTQGQFCIYHKRIIH